MLDEWRQVVSAYFLGALHLDEVQNFFKLPTLKKQRSKSSDAADLELSIIEDQCLKWMLKLTKTWKIPIIISGTSDGVGALMKRLANTQRFVSGGYHPIKHFESADDPAFFSNDSEKPGFLDRQELLSCLRWTELWQGVPNLPGRDTVRPAVR